MATGAERHDSRLQVWKLELHLGSQAQQDLHWGEINGIRKVSPEDLNKLLQRFAPPPAPPPKNIGDWNGSWYGSVLLPGKGAVPVTLSMSDGKIVAFDLDNGPYQIFSDQVMPDMITFFANNQFLLGRSTTDPTSGTSWNVTITASGGSLNELQLALKGGDAQTLTTMLDFRIPTAAAGQSCSRHQ